MKNCPNCGTPLMGGWCPVCHPNARNTGAYKMWAAGKSIQLSCCLVVVLAVLAFLLWAIGCQ